MQEKYFLIDDLKTFLLAISLFISCAFAQDVNQNQLTLKAKSLNYDQLKHPFQIKLTDLELSCRSTWSISSKEAIIDQKGTFFKGGEFKLFHQSIFKLKDYYLSNQAPILPIILPIFSLGKNGNRYGLQIPYQISENLAMHAKLFWFQSEVHFQKSRLFLDLKLNEQIQILSALGQASIDFSDLKISISPQMAIKAQGFWQAGNPSQNLVILQNFKRQQSRYTTGSIHFHLKNFDLQLFQIQNLLWNQSEIWIKPSFSHTFAHLQSQKQKLNLLFSISSFRQITQSNQSSVFGLRFDPYQPIDEIMFLARYQLTFAHFNMQSALKINPLHLQFTNQSQSQNQSQNQVNSKFDVPIQMHWHIDTKLMKSTAQFSHEIKPLIAYDAQIFPFQNHFNHPLSFKDQRSLMYQGKFSFQSFKIGIDQIFSWQNFVLSYQSHLLYQALAHFQIDDPRDLYLFNDGLDQTNTSNLKMLQSIQVLYKKQILMIKTYGFELAQMLLQLQSKASKLSVVYQNLPVFLYQSPTLNDFQHQFPVFQTIKGSQLSFSHRLQQIETSTDLYFSTTQSLRKINQSFKISFCACFDLQLDFSYIKGLSFSSHFQENLRQFRDFIQLWTRDDYRFMASLVLGNF